MSVSQYPQVVERIGAGDGNRTHTQVSLTRILSSFWAPVRPITMDHNRSESRDLYVLASVDTYPLFTQLTDGSRKVPAKCPCCAQPALRIGIGESRLRRSGSDILCASVSACACRTWRSLCCYFAGTRRALWPDASLQNRARLRNVPIRSTALPR